MHLFAMAYLFACDQDQAVAPADSGADSGWDDWVDTGADTDTDTDSGTGDTDSGETGDTDTDTDSGTGDTDSGETGIQVTWAGSVYPTTLTAWYGASSSASAEVSSATETFVVTPSEEDVANHGWIDVMAFSSPEGSPQSSGCAGFSVSSAEFSVQMFEDPTRQVTANCELFLDGALPSGSREGMVAYHP